MSKTRLSVRTILRAGIVLVAIVPLTWSLWVTFAADRTWTGGGVGHPIPSQRNLWTNQLNWSSGIAPSAGDSLFFPQGTLQPTSNNDFPAGTSFNSMTVSTGHLLLGNGVVLNAGLTCSGATIVLSSLDVNLITNPTAGTTALISGPIDNNGDPLGFDGNGNITVSGVISDVNALRTNLNFHGIASLTANNTYTGTTSILAGTLLVMGSQPQSSIDLNGGTIGGTGTVGAIDVIANTGPATVAPGGTAGTGTLNVNGNVAFMGSGMKTFEVSLNGPAVGTGYDQLNVVGTVDLGSSTSLDLNVSFTPSPGNSFVIIKNDGSDPVVGNFILLPEGAGFTINGVPAQVTYRGGDGNDVVVHIPGTKIWDGSGPGNSWATGTNWVGDVAPQIGDDLVFPAGAAQVITNNTFAANTIFKRITLSGTGYLLNGNAINLIQGINATGAGGNQLSTPIKLTNSQAFQINTGSSVVFTNNIDTNGFNLTISNGGATVCLGVISGAGSLIQGSGTTTLQAANAYSGSTTIQDGGVLIVNGSQPQSDVTLDRGTLGGVGTVGAVRVQAFDSIGRKISPGALNNGTGILNVNGNLAFNGINTAPSSVDVDLNGTTVGSDYDQLNVTGFVNLGSRTLNVTLGFVPTAGASFTIINNDNSDGISNPFGNLPEGSGLTINNTTFIITYRGGIGANDVVLRVGATRTWDGGGADNNWTTADNWVGNIAPQFGDNLVFPSAAARLTNNNDFPADTTFHSIIITGGGYTIEGNALKLHSGLTATNSGQSIFSPSIGGPGGVRVLSFANLTLNGNNGYTGPTTIDSSASLVVNGSQPNSPVTLTSGSLSGFGIVGPVTATGGGVNPSISPDSLDNTLNVNGNLTFSAGAFFVETLDSVSGVVQGRQVNVNGTVTLNNCLLSMALTTLPPLPAGLNIPMINNDGTDAVSGTFNNIPEGSTFTKVGITFGITYRGGDGNDVVLHTPGNKTWDGGGTTNNWSEGANWVGDAAPGPGDDLIFPAGAARLQNVNDFAGGTTFNSLTFSGGGYVLNGNAIALNNGLTDSSQNVFNQIRLASIKINNNQTFSNTFSLLITSDLDTNGKTLTVDGPGSKSFRGPISGTGGLIVNGTGLTSVISNPGESFTNTFSGPTIINDGSFFLGIAQPNSQAQLNGGILTGNGTINSIVATGGTIHRFSSGQIISNNNVTLTSAVTYEVQVIRNNQGQFNGGLTVNGAVDLGNSTLTILPDFLIAPAIGEVFTLVTKSSSGAIQGTFNNLPEGAVLPIAGNPFRISYVGGNGNDVTLTALAGLSINDVSLNEGNAGTTNATFNVTLSPASNQTVTVNFATTNGTATAGLDYQSISGTLTFNPNETSKTITVQVNGDTAPEPNETFTVDLTNPTNASLVDAQGLGTIVDDDTDSIQFSAATYTGSEGDHTTTITVTRTGNTSVPASVDFETADGTATERKDYTTALGTIRFAASETQKTFNVLLTDDGFAESEETVNLILSNAIGTQLGSQATATLNVTDNELGVPSPINPIDNPPFFVRMHYHDFFTREPDPAGFQFWINQITECGSNLQCIELRRINVSAAFYLSIEFQETGYLVYRMYKTAFGNLPGKPVPVQLRPFLRDTQRIGEGVQVGIGDWELQLEQNKQAFSQEFVARAQFMTAYPTAMSAEQFVDTLNANAGGALSTDERNQLVAELISGARTRAQVLRAVAEDQTLHNAEFNKAFVLMQYFGYLRRNPDDAPEPTLDFAGYNFWLGKLNQFNGNFIQADMVKSFIVSGEYKERFR